MSTEAEKSSAEAAERHTWGDALDAAFGRFGRWSPTYRDLLRQWLAAGVYLDAAC
jgi:hypothetical protein